MSEQDIINEFGVDIETLIEISKAKMIWTFHPETQEDYWRYLDWDKVYVDLTNKCICFTDDNDPFDEYLSKPLKEYKKTWAIKKEDLMNL